MKMILPLLFASLFLVSGLYAAGFSKKGKAGPLKVEYSSERPLVADNVDFTIAIKKDNKGVDNAKVKMKVFMPEMPGMPYMEYVDEAKFVKDGMYEVLMNFSMPGTWQVRIYIETEKGKKYLHKSSVII